MKTAIALAEKGFLPESMLRWGMRRLMRRRLSEESLRYSNAADSLEAFLQERSLGPIAERPEKANEQHYEVPTGFYRLVLGKRMKYSSCHWPQGVRTLDEAEESSLGVSCARAELADGQDILELGCGWGSLTLWMAEHYPNSRILAVSNSRTQKEHILAESRARSLGNVEVLTGDVNRLEIERRFDRVVSVEMFEHVRNHSRLIRGIASWLKPQGLLFVHVFCHRHYAYLFETDGADDWMGRNFFTGGIMPSEDLLPMCRGELALQGSWRWSGEHYQKTAEAWLANLDERRDQALSELAKADPKDAPRMVQRWRMFFMACAELFGFAGGREWGVCHYVFRKPG